MLEERKQRTAAAAAAAAPALRPIILPEQLDPSPPLPAQLEIVIDPVEYEAYQQKRRAEKKEKQLLKALNTDGFDTPTSQSSNPVTPVITNRKTLTPKSTMEMDSPKGGSGLKNPLVWALNSGSFFFKAQPKPLRPQLQQFM
jgi:cell division protein FtsN